MFTVFKVANVITATVGGGGGGVFASALALESLKPTIFGSTFAPDALETEADAFGERRGCVFHNPPPAH